MIDILKYAGKTCVVTGAASGMGGACARILTELGADVIGLDVQEDRTLWRDQAQLVLAEAVLYSFDQAGVRISDHHGIGHEFLEFCRSEHRQGREIQAEWSWVVPPMASVSFFQPSQSFSAQPSSIETMGKRVCRSW